MNGNYNSDTTIIKQEKFEKLLDLHIRVCQQIFSKPNTVNKIYRYIDTFSGLGDGSPSIFKKLIEQHSLEFEADFFEINKEAGKSLKNILKDFGTIRIGDSKLLVQTLAPSDSQYGIAYLDSFGGESLYLDTPQIAFCLSQKFRKVDILLNVNATSIKRPRGAGFTDIYAIDIIDQIEKSYWIVSEPYGKHQWAFLIGTNWQHFPTWEKEGFYNIGSNDGQEILRIINFSKNEDPEIKKLIEKRKKKNNGTNNGSYQLSLF